MKQETITNRVWNIRPQSPTSEHLQMARMEAGLSTSEAAHLGGLTVNDYLRMEKGQKKVMLALYRLLLCWSGQIAQPGWQGWQFREGKIWSPEDQGFSPSDIVSIFWLNASIRTLRSELYHYTGEYYDPDYYHGHAYRSR
ncbi:MAG: phage protein [Candidatus Thiodiazotropha sp. (ex Lucinoma borealis)]|nr:phage protein [Candidatus Thiodiazotropha sp. (ex Lucinoma borealis)]